MRTLKLGRIFGIDINLDISWLLIFVLITANLAYGIFPSLHPEWTTPFNWLMGAIAALFFFASILSHEMAHSLMARARGTKVSSITLFVFGGVANIEREPSSPRSELLITIVGPLTSLVLGLVFLMIGNLAGPGLPSISVNPSVLLQQLSPLATLFIWLGTINIAVGIFNLIPGFPLDGGRVLRSILWSATHDLVRATRYASLAGQGFAWILMLSGALMVFGINVPLFGTGVAGGLWLVFIGWFLNGLAAASYAQVVIEDVLKTVPVSRIMRRNVIPIPQHATVNELVNTYIIGTNEQAFPVMSRGVVSGLVRLSDVKKIPPELWSESTVGEIMIPTEELEVTVPNETASEALRKLRKRERDEILVLEEERIVGLLSMRDILIWLEMNSPKTTETNVGAKRFWFQRS